MIGLRRRFNIPNSNDELLLIQKAFGVLPSIIGVNPANVKEYVLMLLSGSTYTFIDNIGETDGFESYQGAEQFARAYILENYNELGHRFYADLFTNSGNGSLIDKNGNEVDF